MRRAFSAILFLWILHFPIVSPAQIQALRFTHITSEQGLSNSTVESILQDSQGFMWFGTRDGLNRYDGYNIRVYRHSPADSGSISGNYITCLFEDRSGMLWIGTTSGLSRLDRKTGKFKSFKSAPDNPYSISNNRINSIYQDNQGKIWVATANGLSLYQAGKEDFRRFYPDKSAEGGSNQIHCILEDINGYLWLGTETGMQRFDHRTATFSRYSKYPSGAGHAIRVMRKDHEGNLWIGASEEGLFHLSPATGELKRYSHDRKSTSGIGSNLITSILIDKNNNVWVGAVNGGLNLFVPAQNTFQRFQNEPFNSSTLSQRTISAIHEDRQGNLWLGTHRGGVNLYIPSHQSFGFQRQRHGGEGLSHNDVKAFYEDKQGFIWIGTDGGGLNRLDKTTGQYRHYRHNPFDPQSLGSDEVLHVTEDSKGNMWVSTWGGGLNRLDRNTGKFTRFTHDNNNERSISSNFVQQVFEDDEKKIWVATYYGGLNLFNPETNTFTRVFGDEKQLSHVTGNNFVSICQDTDGNIWFGTDDGGLNCYVKTTKQFKQYFTSQDRMPDLRVLFVDSKKRLWVGQAGLYLFNKTKDTFSIFTEQAGLATEFIKGICEDDAGSFWISTSNGIIRFDPEKGTHKRYGTADGLQGPEFEANAYLKTRDGQLLFGGLNGYNAFYPKDIQTNEHIPPVFFTDLYLSNTRVVPGTENAVLTKDIAATHTLTLSYAQSTFAVEFAALNYIVPEHNQYAYRLLGLDTQWNMIGNERKVSYTNLAPGDYILEVKAANNDGKWNETPARMAINITPPFWSTWWFKTLVAIAILSVAFVLLFLKRRYEIQGLEKSKREEMHQMQLQFFTNISHEFRTPLSLILGPLEKLQKEDTGSRFQRQYATMHRNASRLMGLINELMDFRKVEAGALKLKVMPGCINLFLEEIAGEFHALAEEKNIHFELDVPEKLPQTWFDRQVLEKIIINLLSNSFKYTSSGGTITVRVSKQLNELPKTFRHELIMKHEFNAREYLYIQVADNGIGISADSLRFLFERYYKMTDAHLGSGVGLAFVRSLTFLHKGSIFVRSERHQGTEITIALPVHAGDYTEDEKWLKENKQAFVNMESIHNKFDPQVRSDLQKSHPERSIKSRKHILIVDDNDELREFLKESLMEHFDIHEAVDGSSALTAVKEVMPDLIISDVMMPGMNGIDFCNRIKESPETGHIPLIMLTAKAAIESRLEGMASGADFYFSKPLNNDLLLMTIRNIFESQESLKEHWTRAHRSDAVASTHSSKEKQFMEQLTALLHEHLSNPELDVDYISKQMGMSRSKLYQTIKTITGQPIGDFVRTMRLRKAVEIMTEEDVLITEVMYRVGIQTQSYFTKAFKKEFGKTPTQFLQELGK